MAGDEQFNEYCEEVQQAVGDGDVTNDVMHVLQQIDKMDDTNQQQQSEIQDVSSYL